MSNDTLLIKLMSDHKNWFPAAYYDRMTERKTMRHSLEIDFGIDANQADIDRMKGAFKELQNEGIISQKFDIFEYSQPERPNSKKETGYLVIFTTSAKALNVMTRAVKSSVSDEVRDRPVEKDHEEKRWLAARSFGRIASHAADLADTKNSGMHQPCYVFGNSEPYRDGYPLRDYIAESRRLQQYYGAA